MTRSMPGLLMSDEQFDELLPLAVDWAEAQERRILAEGVSLTSEQLTDARAVGVREPYRVRVLAVTEIPQPEHPLLQAAGELLQLISPFTLGLTVSHGIYLRADFQNDRWLLAHELTHTAQYERLGGFGPFLRQYLEECLTVGYPHSPLEQEAVDTAARLQDDAEKAGD